MGQNQTAAAVVGPGPSHLSPRMPASTLQYGIFGHPVGHSLSPDIHNAWFRQYGIDARYDRYDVAPSNLAAEFRMAKDRGIAGLNVTVPHKQAIVELLDDMGSEVRAIGACNTIKLESGGRYRGYNTDAEGFVLSLADDGVRFRHAKALVIGAGGAARAIVYGLLHAGVESVTILNRTHRNAVELANDMRTHVLGGQALTARGWDGSAIDVSQYRADLVVHTTTKGMSGDNPSPELRGDLHGIAVVDIVYRPLETALLQQARTLGASTYDGLRMLAGQAALSFEIWAGIRPEWRKAYDSLKHTLQA